MDIHELECPNCGHNDFGLIRAGLNWKSVPRYILKKIMYNIIFAVVFLVCGICMQDGIVNILRVICTVLGIGSVIAYLVIQIRLTVLMIKAVIENCDAVYSVCKNCGYKNKIIENINEA